MNVIAASAVAFGTGLIGYLVGRSWAPAPAAAPPDPPVTPGRDPDRDKLLLLTAWVFDRVGPGAVRERIETELEKCGAALIEPSGVPLDDDRHEKVGTEPAADPALAGQVARTVAPGLLDGARVLRRARVSVYFAEPARPAAAAPIPSEENR